MSSPIFSALQKQVLDELGIELWHNSTDAQLPASADCSTRETPVLLNDPPPPVNPVTKLAPPEQIESVPAVRFALSCLHNSKLLVIAESPESRDIKLVSSLVQVADASVKAQQIQFKWPQLDTNAGIDAARKAFSAFVLRQHALLNDGLVLLLGARVLELLPEEIQVDKKQGNDIATFFKWQNMPCIASPEPESLRQNWQCKRDLCFQIAAHAPGAFFTGV